jgi:hypothetical protein
MGTAKPEEAATDMFRAGVKRSPKLFDQTCLRGVCDGPIDTLNKYAECLHRTTYRNGENTFTVYDLLKHLPTQSVRAVARQEFAAKDVAALSSQFLSTYYGEKFTCVDVTALDLAALEYRSRIVVALFEGRWHAMPRCRSSIAFYQVADAMQMTTATAAR